MNDAQIWTMIGAFTALMFGMLTVVSTLFIRVVRAEIGGLRSELHSEIGGLRTEMNARFDIMDAKLKGLDTEVHALVKHTFGFDRD
jgi:hypothetical protein